MAHRSAVPEAQFGVLQGFVRDCQAPPHPMGASGSAADVQGERVARDKKRIVLLALSRRIVRSVAVESALGEQGLFALLGLGTLQRVESAQAKVVDELFDVDSESLTDDLGDAVRRNL